MVDSQLVPKAISKMYHNNKLVLQTPDLLWRYWKRKMSLEWIKIPQSDTEESDNR